MKTTHLFICALLLLSSAASSSWGESHGARQTKFWANLCESCHNGRTAPDAEWMKGKYRTAEEFAAAVREKGDRCMNLLKNDPGLARKIAIEIGIREKQSE